MYQALFHIILVLTLTSLFSCTSPGKENISPDTEGSREKVAGYIVGAVTEGMDSLAFLTEADAVFFKKHGIPRELRPSFLTIYNQVRTNLSTVYLPYRGLRGVRFFLIHRMLLHSADSLGKHFSINSITADNSVYMAFSLYSEGLPDMRYIGNQTYIKTLARSFGTREWQIMEGVWTLLIQPPSQLLESVVKMVNANLDDTSVSEPVFFFDNIIVPYLTYVSKGYPFHASVEDRIFSGYAALFSGNDTLNELRAFTDAFKAYLAGETLNVRYINNLNTALGKHKLRLFVRHKTCISYHILDDRIPISFSGIGEVVFLKKANITLSASFLGLSTIREPDVILTVDDIADYTDDVAYALDNGTSLTPVLKLNGTGPTDSITVWCAKLLQKEFAGLSRDEITRRLIRQITVHEVKHKWDEMTGADSDWYTLDCEVSAHLTECVYGGIPFYSLMSFQNRLGRFYTNIAEPSVRSKLRNHIMQCRDCIRLTAVDSLTTNSLRRELQRMYTEYRTIGGDTLPSLDRFYKEVVKPDLETFPEVVL